MLHNRLYMSSRRDFNDPLDTQFAIDVPDDSEAIAAFIEGVMSRADPGTINASAEHLARIADPQAFRETSKTALEASLDSIGIYSMTDRVAHPLMWAHYAGSHRGIALMFKLGDGEDSIGAPYPVRYQETYPRSALRPSGLDIHLMLIKGMAWSYEQEWRLVDARRARQWVTISPGCLKGVIFGAQCSAETWGFVLDLVRRRADAGLPPLQILKADTGESFDLQFSTYIGNDQWRPIELP